jgi:hypothetical protein
MGGNAEKMKERQKKRGNKGKEDRQKGKREQTIS